MSQEIEVVIQRDSVSMGDDIQAPHEYRVWMSSQITLETFFTALNLHLYLPKIVTGEAVWTLENKFGKSIALMAQQWQSIHYFVDPHSQFSEQFIFDEHLQGHLIFVGYHQQIQPEQLIERLK